MNKVVGNILLYLAVLLVIGIGVGFSEFISALTIPGTILFTLVGYALFSVALSRVEPAVRSRLAALEPKQAERSSTSEAQGRPQAGEQVSP